jgi:hypothetical protein
MINVHHKVMPLAFITIKPEATLLICTLSSITLHRFSDKWRQLQAYRGMQKNRAARPRFEKLPAVVAGQINRDSHSAFDYNAAFAQTVNPL